MTIWWSSWYFGGTGGGTPSSGVQPGEIVLRLEEQQTVIETIGQETVLACDPQEVVNDDDEQTIVAATHRQEILNDC